VRLDLDGNLAANASLLLLFLRSRSLLRLRLFNNWFWNTEEFHHRFLKNPPCFYAFFVLMFHSRSPFIKTARYILSAGV
jgi:hypothetical protein